MNSWLAHLKQGLSRPLPKDPIAAQQGHSRTRGSLKNLRPFFIRHWKKGALGATLVILASLLSFPQPLITRYLIDNVILSRQLALLAGAIVLLVGIALAEKGMTLLQEFYFARYEQEVILDLQHHLLDRALRFPKSFFDANETGYLMSRLSFDVQGLRWFFSSTLVRIVSNAVRLIGGIGLLFYLEWRLAVGVLIILPGLMYSVYYFSGKIYALGHHGMEQQAQVSGRFQESLSALSLIKAFALEGGTVRRLMSALRKAFQISLEQSMVNSVANMAIYSMPGMARVIALASGAYWVVTDQWTLGSLLAFQAYLGHVFSPAQFLSTVNLQLQTARASLDRVSGLFEMVSEENMGTGIPVERLSGEVEFKGVSFSYDPSVPVLQEVSFRVGPGERVAIVGPSGVGKTTLISLILRFYKPTAGEIFFDGRPASDYEVGSLRRRIGYVSQSTLLLSGTILENLCYGNPEAPEEKVFQAARAAGIYEFILSLPAGYESEIGEKGVNLSEGQKQRLSIARALVKDPDILVLDEPTSAVDSLTERSIFESLPAVVKEKTLFVVAHRSSTFKNSDRILLLNENRLVDSGTHQSLSKTNDYYRSLVACQPISRG